MGYVNVYQHRDVQFVGKSHPNRAIADEAARIELHFEPLTRRVGLLRVKLKSAA